jgi:membrane protein implicated in regulation of membrane protease activity
VIGLVLLLMAIGFGLAKLVALPFGGAGTFVSLLLGLVIIVAILGLLALFGRRRQAKARAKALEARSSQGKR